MKHLNPVHIIPIVEMSQIKCVYAQKSNTSSIHLASVASVKPKSILYSAMKCLEAL